MTTERAVVAVAPLRVDFTGGYTDIAPYTDDQASTTVNAAVGYFASASASARQDGRCLILRDGELVAELDLRRRDRVTRDLVSTVVLAGAPAEGVSLDVRLDLPPRSGLGTSGAVGVAVTRALMALKGETVVSQDVAEVAAASEREAEIAGGKQDQYAAAFGGVRAIEFEPRSTPTVHTIAGFAEDILRTGLIAHAGGGRESSELVRNVMSAYTTGDPRVVNALGGLVSAAPEIRRALTVGDVDCLGECLTEVRRLQSELAHEIRTAIERSPFMELVRQGRCWGKPLGGAGPGAAWLLLPSGSTPEELAACVRRQGFACWPCSTAPGVRVGPTAAASGVDDSG